MVRLEFFKNTLVAKQSCEKDHSNSQSKDFSESRESKDVSKSHAEGNVTHFSGSNVVNQQCTPVKKAIQKKNSLHCKEIQME